MASSPAEILRATPVFRDLSDEDRHLFARIGQTKLYPEGEIIFSEGDPADHLYTVARGKVKVFKMTPSGKELILSILGPGVPVGAVAVYESIPFPASAVAFEDSVLIRIPARGYFELLEKHPDLVRRLLGAMTHRLMELNQRFPEEYMTRLTDDMIAETVKMGGVIRGYPNMPSSPHIKGDEMVGLIAFVRRLSDQERKQIELTVAKFN